MPAPDAAAPDAAAPDRRAPDLWFTEQLEALAIAVAMALVLKFFVIEAYQIPSGSMQPTILGDPDSGIHDRVIADKLCTMLRAPRRWEVMIFRFPSDERRLYVKRIVGLPGEELSIRGGDLWVDGAIARKPDAVNEAVLKRIPPLYGDVLDLGRAFLVEGGGVDVIGTRADFDPGGAGLLRLAEVVTARYLDGYDHSWGIAAKQSGPEAVADLDVTLTATLGDDARELRVTLTADDGERVFVVPRAGAGREARVEHHPRPSPGLTGRGAEPVVLWSDAGRAVPAGRPVEIVARHVDRRLLLVVDGEEWLRHDEDGLGPRTDRPRIALVTLALPGGGRIEDVVVRRDIYYTPRELPDPTWRIPPDHYFGLGDNTQASLDGRGFARRTYRLEDGRVVSGFDFEQDPAVAADANPVYEPDGTIVFADAHGDVHRFRAEDVVPAPDGRPFEVSPFPFIHRRYLLGKVLAVFWPVVDPFRWKFVR